MIKTERQYRISKAQAEKFARAVEEFAQTGAQDERVHPVLRQAQADALRSQLESLRRELDEYDALREGGIAPPAYESFRDLPTALVQARIRAGLTQRELAEHLGLKEQQIQRYEATGYAGASLARITQVVEELGLTVRVAS